MRHARPEKVIIVAIIGVLLAIGVPALERGHAFTGGVLVLLAVGVALRTLWALWEERR